MKNKYIFWGALLIPTAIWLLAPLAAAYPSWLYSKLHDDCSQNSTSAATCDALIAKRGQSGDIYGIVSSLFSGLALFGIAYTLLSDLAIRRKEKKPVIVCRFSNSTDPGEAGDVFLSSTNIASMKTAAINTKITIEVIGAPALNTKISIIFIIGSTKFHLKTFDIGIPIRDGGSTIVDFSSILDGASIIELGKAFPNSPQLSIEIVASCQNLDGISFETFVRYKLKLRYVKQLQKIQWFSSDEPDFADAWSDPAPVVMAATLDPGSWRFESDQPARSAIT